MSERLTSDYLKNLDNVYVNGAGKVGRIGEEVTERIFRSKGYNTVLTLDHKPSQDVEIDMYFWESSGEQYACEIKTNLTHDHQWVWVDKKAFRKSESDVWFHLNKNDYADYVMYDRLAMKRYLNTTEDDIRHSNDGTCWLVDRSIVQSLSTDNPQILEILERLTNNENID